MPLRGEEFNGTNFKWDNPSRLLEKSKQRKADDKHERKVYAKVDQRDGLRCVVTGRKGNPYALDPLDRLHHHHILQRGRDLGPTETWNVCLVHRLTHALINRNDLTTEGNADKKLVIGIKASAAEELFGRRSAPPHVTVVPDDLWTRWLDEHACRMTKKWGQ